MSETVINVPGRFNPIEYGTPLANASDIYDTTNEKSVQETLNDENNKIALQDTKIDILNTAGELVVHPEGYLVKAYNIGDIFYKIETTRDIQVKHYYVARVDGYAGDQITDTDKFIDAGTSSVSALNVKTTIIKDSLKGDNAYGVYVKQWREEHPTLEPTSENGFLEQDEWLESLIGDSAYDLAVKEGFESSEADWLNSLKGEKGDNAISPFKGWLDSTSKLPTNPHVGDYVYIKDNGTTYVYRCTTEGEWPTTSTEEKEPSDATFASAQLINNVKIDDTHLANPIGSDEDNNPTLAKAEDVMQLKTKLEGVTASETKVTQESTIGSYVRGSDGTIIPSSNTAYIEIALGNAKSVRFIGGLYTSSIYISGYAFGHYTNPSDPTTWVTDKSSVFDSNASTLGIKEYVFAVPEGATHFRTTTATGSVPTLAQKFYCYMRNGYNVDNMINHLDAKTNGKDVVDIEDVTDSSNWLTANWGCFWNTTDLEKVAYKYTSVGSYYSITSRFKVWKQNGSRVRVTAGSSYNCYVTFLKSTSLINESKTLQQLLDGYLSNVHTNNAVFVVPTNTTQEFIIPEDCNRIVFTKWFYKGDSDYGDISNTNRLPSKIEILTNRHIDGTIDDAKKELQQQIDSNKEYIEELQGVGEQVDGLVDELYGEKQEIIINGLNDYGTYSGMSISQDDYKLYTVASSPRKTHYIDINGCISLTIQPKDDVYCIFFISNQQIPKGQTYSDSQVKSTFLVECENYVKYNGYYYMRIPAGSDPVTIILNNEAKYLYWQVHYTSTSYDYSPKRLDILNIKRVGGILEQISKEESNQGNALKLVIKDGKCFTNPIPCEKGFHLLVKDDYRITNAYLVDHLTGNIVNDDFITNNISSVQNKIYRRRSNMSRMPGFDIIYQIEKLDGSIIESSLGIIEEFSIVEDFYKRKFPDGIDLAIYRAFREKVQTSIGNVWTPSLNAANKISSSHGDTNPKRFRRGVTYIGVNYSGPTQWGKHVGIEVSMKTFKTAVANPRSVMYTERIGAYNGTSTKSAYGFTHASYGREGGAYYGCVCTGLTSYLLGLNSVITSDLWRVVGTSLGSKMFNIVMQGTAEDPNTILCGESEYRYDNDNDCRELVTMLQPMDFIWKEGHCAVISDIYVDEWGEIKYIVISEQTTPTSTSNAYNPHFFFLRFKDNVDAGYDWQILRRKENFPWTLENASIPRVSQDKEFVIMDNYQYNPPDMGNIDGDITTFAGEGAVFVIGDYSDSTNNFKMFLNVHRGGSYGYNYIQLFNESDDESTATPIDEIDISSNGGNVAQSNILDVDAADKEDWIIYNLAEYWRVSQVNNIGKFKARVVKKESNSVVVYSGCTHFEFIKIEVSINTETNKFGFVVKGGTPMQYRIESANGIITDASVKDLTLSDYTTEDDVHTGTNLIIPSSWDSGYIRLFVKTDYGMANRRIAYTKPNSNT